MMFFDPMYFLFLIPGMALAGWAQWRVKSAYAAAGREPSRMTGAQAARQILDNNGLNNVDIEEAAGRLTDHF
ncbi:MAG: zinc metallopeptidase, partial [Phycisphaerae bacterium]